MKSYRGRIGRIPNAADYHHRSVVVAQPTNARAARKEGFNMSSRLVLSSCPCWNLTSTITGLVDAPAPCRPCGRQVLDALVPFPLLVSVVDTLVRLLQRRSPYSAHFHSSAVWSWFGRRAGLPWLLRRGLVDLCYLLQQLQARWSVTRTSLLHRRPHPRGSVPNAGGNVGYGFSWRCRHAASAAW